MRELNGRIAHGNRAAFSFLEPPAIEKMEVHVTMLTLQEVFGPVN